MLICELLPLKTTKKINSLTYFTSLNVSAGDLVQINMNGQILDALIITVSDIRSSKSEVKAQDFKIKKIIKIIKKSYVSEDLLTELYNLATLLCTTLSNILNTLSPIDILHDINFEKRSINNDNKKDEIREVKLNILKVKKINKTELKDIKLISDKKYIHKIYPTIKQLRKAKREYIFDKKESKTIKKVLQKNNLDYINKKEVNIKESYKHDISERPEISFSTPNLSFLTDKNISKVILYDESSKYYYSNFKSIDTKKAITYICNLLNIEVEYSCDLPSLELYKERYLLTSDEARSQIIKKESKNIENLDVDANKISDILKIKGSAKAELKIIKMTDKIYLDNVLENNILNCFKEKENINKKDNSISNKKRSNKRILLYSMRKGMYTQSVCSDCGEVVICKKCKKPYTLISKKEDYENEYDYINENNYEDEGINKKQQSFNKEEGFEENKTPNEIRYHVCNTCRDNIRLESILKCEVCNSWNIKTLGIATQGIEKYLEELFEKNKIEKNKKLNLEELHVNKKDIATNATKKELCKSAIEYKKYNIFRIDADNANTPSKAEKEYKRFLDTTDNQPGILIVTEAVIPILDDNTFDAVIIVSLDSAFYLTDYNTDEKIFFMINKLRSYLRNIDKDEDNNTNEKNKINEEEDNINAKGVNTKQNNNFYLQTRMSDKFIESNLKVISDNDADIFYKKELKNRERNMLPPYNYILTYEANHNLSIPLFLKDYKNLKIKINFDISRFVFFIPKNIWEQGTGLRSLCLENLYNLNLKINSKEIL